MPHGGSGAGSGAGSGSDAGSDAGSGAGAGTGADSGTASAVGAGREPDWAFSFGEGERAAVPPPPRAVVDEIEFAKSTLHHELAGVARTSLHLQSLLRRAHREGLSTSELAVHAGLGVESVEAVLGGASLIDHILGAGGAPTHHPA